MENQNKRKQRLVESFLDGDISGKICTEIVQKTEVNIQRLKHEIQQSNQSKDDLYRNLIKVTEYVTNIVKIYQQADIQGKQNIIGSIFPRKFVFDENGVRTDQINQVVDWIIKSDNALRRNKKGQPGKKPQLSCQVIPPGLFHDPIQLHFENKARPHSRTWSFLFPPGFKQA